METAEKDISTIKNLKDGEHCYFNMFQDGGARCDKCNGMYLLFSIPIYGGKACYEKTYYGSEIEALVSNAHSWT